VWRPTDVMAFADDSFLQPAQNCSYSLFFSGLIKFWIEVMRQTGQACVCEARLMMRGKVITD
jgi:hypothetical protein